MNPFVSIIDNRPHSVRKLAKGYMCIAGFRQFKLAQAMPDHEKMVIPVIIFPGRLNAEKKISLLTAELFMSPALFSLRNGDARILAGAWDALKKQSDSLSLRKFAAAMRIDMRSCQPKKRNKISKKDT